MYQAYQDFTTKSPNIPIEIGFQDDPSVFLGPSRDDEQPNNFDNREIKVIDVMDIKIIGNNQDQEFPMKHKFQEAIRAINDKIAINDDHETWWPKILRRESDFSKSIHDIDGVEAAASSSDRAMNEFDESRANSYLRLVLRNSPCELFAYPVEFGIRPVDVIVGFMSENKDDLTLAWDDDRVYPLIGNNEYIRTLPDAAKWIIAASMSTEYRRVVSLFCQKNSASDIKNCTSPLHTIRTRTEAQIQYHHQYHN